MKKPANRPEWHEIQDQLEFTADGMVYGRVERFRTAWQGTFDGKPPGRAALHLLAEADHHLRRRRM